MTLSRTHDQIDRPALSAATQHDEVLGHIGNGIRCPMSQAENPLMEKIEVSKERASPFRLDNCARADSGTEIGDGDSF